MVQKSSFGIKEIGQLIQQLKAENNPANNKLIAFYERKIGEAINKAFNTAFQKLQP